MSLECPLTPGQQEERDLWLSDPIEAWIVVGFTLYLRGGYNRFRPLPNSSFEPLHARM